MATRERDDKFSNKVARLCCEHFKKLDKKGKPQGKHEWTLMAAVVLIQEPGLLNEPNFFPSDSSSNFGNWECYCNGCSGCISFLERRK